MRELEQREVLQGLLEANYNGKCFEFPSGHLFAPRLMGGALDKVVMKDLKMASADLRFCSMTEAKLTSVDLASAQGQESGLSRALFQKVSLRRSFFSKAVAY